MEKQRQIDEYTYAMKQVLSKKIEILA